MDRVPRAWMKPLDDDYRAKPLPERKRRPWRATVLGRAVMAPIDRLLTSGHITLRQVGRFTLSPTA